MYVNIMYIDTKRKFWLYNHRPQFSMLTARSAKIGIRLGPPSNDKGSSEDKFHRFQANGIIVHVFSS